MDLIVGTFNHEALYTLHFSFPTRTDATATLKVIRDHPAIGGHSWLALSKDKKFLYCTVWHPTRPSVAAYRVTHSGRELQFLNAKPVQNMSGYVCVSGTHLYSVGGATGEVFTLGPDGEVGDLIQSLDFVRAEETNLSAQRGAVPHGDFGGLRHGAHSCDLSIDGRTLFVADIGRNCIWTYSVHARYRGATSEHALQIGSWTYDNPATAGKEDKPQQHLVLGTKHISRRAHDGPRHTWPHPNGKVLYSLQEHSSMVDVFAIAADGVTLRHVQGVRIIPADKDCAAYWADEVRLSTGPDPARPRFMYASTRGLQAETKGYVAVFALGEDGLVVGDEDAAALDIWETPTSGGIANAIEPAPWHEEFGEMQYFAMTDSEEGWVFMLGFDGTNVQEVARVNLGKTDDGEVVGAATAVWL